MHKPITRHHLKLLDAAEAIRFDPDKVEAAFMARQLVQATLPHKNPGNAARVTRSFTPVRMEADLMGGVHPLACPPPCLPA